MGTLGLPRQNAHKVLAARMIFIKNHWSDALSGPWGLGIWAGRREWTGKDPSASGN